MGPGAGPRPSPQTPQQASLLRALGCKNRWALKWRGLQAWSRMEGQDSALGRWWRRLPCARWGNGQGWCFQRRRGLVSGVGQVDRPGKGCSAATSSPPLSWTSSQVTGPVVLQKMPSFQRKLCGRAYGRPQAEPSALVPWGPAPPTWSRHMTEHARLPQTLWVAASPRSS